jgi:hypothetical protein
VLVFVLAASPIHLARADSNIATPASTTTKPIAVKDREAHDHRRQRLLPRFGTTAEVRLRKQWEEGLKQLAHQNPELARALEYGRRSVRRAKIIVWVWGLASTAIVGGYLLKRGGGRLLAQGWEGFLQGGIDLGRIDVEAATYLAAAVVVTLAARKIGTMWRPFSSERAIKIYRSWLLGAALEKILENDPTALSNDPYGYFSTLGFLGRLSPKSRNSAPVPNFGLALKKIDGNWRVHESPIPELQEGDIVEQIAGHEIHGLHRFAIQRLFQGKSSVEVGARREDGAVVVTLGERVLVPSP